MIIMKYAESGSIMHPMNLFCKFGLKILTEKFLSDRLDLHGETISDKPGFGI